MTDGVTLITCTGGRPEAFGLCKRWVRAQTWTGPLQWIIVYDDEEELKVGSDERLIVDIGSRLLVTIIHPHPCWQPGQNTLARNLLAAIPEVIHDKVLFCEDDDYYAPAYIETMARYLESDSLVGEAPARYYHVPQRKYWTLDNVRHASLCQTGMSSELLPLLVDVCGHQGQNFIDVRMWRMNEGSQCTRLINSGLVVGIKGLPGRPGIGIGHRPEYSGGWQSDPDMKVLRSWIGDDATAYEEFSK